MTKQINKNIPCYNCTERKVGCHGMCEAYQKYSAENQKRNELIRTSKSTDYNKHFT